MTDTTNEPERARPEAIKAVPVRHPGRWLAVAVLAVLTAMFVHMLVTNKNFHWDIIVDNAFRPNVIEGVRTTVFLTIASMIIGILLGIVLAVMRLSSNPILSTVSWLYTWFFRAVPRLVLAILFGNMGILYKKYTLGFPFEQQVGDLLGIDLNTTIFSVKAATLLSGLMAGLLALALSEAAYMAEIVRAGILSVDPGQREAAQALGMSQTRLMRRILLPQAMRVIIPPTGNETIAMLKDTALVAFVPVTNELFFRLQAVGTRMFLPFPMLVAACLWYAGLTSVLLVGQFFIERHFARGTAVTGEKRRGLRALGFGSGSGGA
ncbi:amino acid ABC transporter permease [Actinomadura barringtoniae]|uniref:Amino acid ABC transporter permease n=1 Tax=Actinomadura barringtoniae TaxID=1427535 RepID=A0A939PIB6_9ACTN|nr:amino acid ABC transporter permease [Actinomadura barringtoniae]MBO2450344.1 amino acid ABC transporter permease [Actinomadura barringtoniae]